MKIKFTHYITAICIAFMSFTAQAQSKVTHIDFQKLVSEMPEVIASFYLALLQFLLSFLSHLLTRL